MKSYTQSTNSLYRRTMAVLVLVLSILIIIPFAAVWYIFWYTVGTLLGCLVSSFDATHRAVQIWEAPEVDEDKNVEYIKADDED